MMRLEDSSRCHHLPTWAALICDIDTQSFERTFVDFARPVTTCCYPVSDFRSIQATIVRHNETYQLKRNRRVLVHALTGWIEGAENTIGTAPICAYVRNWSIKTGFAWVTCKFSERIHTVGMNTTWYSFSFYYFTDFRPGRWGFAVR